MGPRGVSFALPIRESPDHVLHCSGICEWQVPASQVPIPATFAPRLLSSRLQMADLDGQKLAVTLPDPGLRNYRGVHTFG